MGPYRDNILVSFFFFFFCPQALAATWKQACESSEPSEVVIPKGVFYLTQAKFEGPCKAAPITFKFEGTLQANTDPSKIPIGEWVTFRYIDGLIITGGGTFDGKGNEAWLQNNCQKTFSCKKLPYVSQFLTLVLNSQFLTSNRLFVSSGFMI